MSRLSQLAPALALGLGLGLALLGCSNDASNDAPIIDYVDAPLVVSAKGGSYAIPISIGFHDNDAEVVTRVRYRSVPSIDGFVDISTPIPTRESADVTLIIPAPAMDAGERRELEITIIDGRGAESRPLARAVTFE